MRHIGPSVINALNAHGSGEGFALQHVVSPETHQLFSFSVEVGTLSKGVTTPHLGSSIAATMIVVIGGEAHFNADGVEQKARAADTILVLPGNSVVLNATEDTTFYLIRTPGLTGLSPQPFSSGGGNDVIYISSKEGPSYWQPLPTTGYVTLKVTPELHGLLPLALASQYLVPGAWVRYHAHRFNEEALMVVRGSGRFLVDGVYYDAKPGTVAYVPPNVAHRIEADEGEELEFFAILSPSGIERVLSQIGRAREIGSKPLVFERTPATAQTQLEQGFVLHEVSDKESVEKVF